MATSSVSELVQAVKRPRALSESTNRPFRKSGGGKEENRDESLARRNSESVAPPRRNSHAGTRSTMDCISELPEKKQRKSGRRSFMGYSFLLRMTTILIKGCLCTSHVYTVFLFDIKLLFRMSFFFFFFISIRKKSQSNSESLDAEIVMGDDWSDEDEGPDSVDDKVRKKEMRKGIDLATTLERIEKNFVITDPRLPDNPIIFASDSFLELTEYSREEILGRNCRFLQGPETDPATVKKIREAIDNQTDVTVQLINYTKSGKKFWNVFHLQPMRDQKGEVQYFIGVQLDGSQHVEPLRNCIPEDAAKESEKLVSAFFECILHLFSVLSLGVWCQAYTMSVYSVHLVELCGTGLCFAMKAMDKSVMLNRNKVHRACAEREILDMLDHPFLPALYASFQTKTHVCLITDYYPGGELFLLLDRQPTKVLKEGAVSRFLQGSDTDPEDVAKIREALQAGTSYCGRLLNYKKDGTPFWNLLTIAPIKDDNGNILKFIGMQVEVSKHTEGSKDKMVRPNGLPESLIRYDARQKEMATSSVSELVQAVKRPRALSESTNRPFRKSGGGKEENRDESLARRNSESVAPPRRNSHAGTRSTMDCISELPEKKQRKSGRRSFMGIRKKSQSNSESLDAEIVMGDDWSDEDEGPDSVDDKVRKKEMRKGIDLATTLERIEKNFVITDPRLPDNPIIFASDSFLELTEYSREEILGRNCRFLQGPETDPATVKKIREAIDNQTDVTVQLINYTKSGKKFWNVFHLQPMRDQKGEVQYFIGVQLDGSQHVEPLRNCIPEDAAKESEKLIKETAENVDDAARELPDANLTPEDLWTNHSKMVHPKPHRKDTPSWRAVQKIIYSGEQIGLKHFRPIKPLGSGDTGSVHLVELCGTGLCFAMKAMDKSVMLNRNKVHRACAEREILDMLDHPFLPALYASFQTKTHVCLITDYYPGGELFLLLDRQPTKVLKEGAVRFYAAEVVVALEYLHCQGIIYRDLKPENVLLQSNGHVSLTDFDLSCLTSCKPQLLLPSTNEKKKKQKSQQNPIFMAEPMRASNSFVGTEEYIAPEIITGAGHTSEVDWWALGILLYEMFYGYTPFRGKTRQKTFSNILQKDLRFPGSIQVSLQAKQLMYRLLHKDPKNRLGSREGANEIKCHPFFRGVNWALVRCMNLVTDKVISFQNPPELDAPLFGTTEAEKEAKMIDPELQDLQTNVF
ncbi:Phototropin-1 [Morella rubra]|uniref:non-specific serine/threonine protein kinase n=1 Tax=Morella rubra TaxID=262757 RepID=A0A6A1WN31_9ROSI|nr:Phototropin-1 [Morella rubra]